MSVKQVVLKFFLFLLTLLLVVALFLVALFLMRPARTKHSEQLFQGVSYTRKVWKSPRPVVIHIVTIDLTAPGVRVLVTPGDNSGGMELIARTTSKFLDEFNLQVAINGGFFSPMHSHSPWDYSPHNGDPINVSGLGISNGVEYSPDNDYSAVLCIEANNQAQIEADNCPPHTQQAIAGNMMLLTHGKPLKLENLEPEVVTFFENLHPRTVVALDEAGQTMWLLIVDGRQAGYSEGVTLTETINLVSQLGADTALHLDGGGSTTLVAAGQWGAHALNAPIHTRIPMRQRPVANHLGIYAQPLNP